LICGDNIGRFAFVIRTRIIIYYLKAQETNYYLVVANYGTDEGGEAKMSYNIEP
jgi:hypothetical protein